MTETDRIFNDPKIQLILSIKQHDEKITFFLENNRYSEAGKSLHYLLSRLEISDNPQDETMRQIRRHVTLENYHQLTLSDFDFAYTELHKFLNRTYYKGFSNNRPPTRTSTIQSIGEKIREGR